MAAIFTILYLLRFVSYKTNLSTYIHHWKQLNVIISDLIDIITVDFLTLFFNFNNIAQFRDSKPFKS